MLFACLDGIGFMDFVGAIFTGLDFCTLGRTIRCGIDDCCTIVELIILILGGAKLLIGAELISDVAPVENGVVCATGFAAGYKKICL